LFIASSLSFSYSETDVKKLKFTGICENCDFSGVNFFDYDFWTEPSKYFLTPPGAAKAPFYIDLTNKILNGSNFKGANLSNVSLYGSMLEGTNFEEANLSGANLNRASLKEANFKNANLSGASLDYVRTKNTNFTFANLSNSNYEEHNPDGNQYVGAQVNAIFKNANLTNIKTQRFNLKGLDLREANFTGTNLVNANLKDADLTGAVFRNANISGARVRNANFTAVDLSQTMMQKVSFNLAILCGTIMPWGKEDSGCTKIEKPKTDMDDFDL
jgi:uncharacterized protein YjbI with pentapeptide repeats